MNKELYWDVKIYEIYSCQKALRNSQVNINAEATQ